MQKLSLSSIPKGIKIVVASLIILLIAAFFAVGWYFSGQLINLKLQTVDYDQTIQSVKGGDFTINGSAYNVDGIMGGIRSNGSTIGIFNAPVNKKDTTKTSTRALTNPTGPVPAVGDKISLQGNIWITNPKAALGIDYQDVTYMSPVGTMKAWVIPNSDSHTWTIAVHGIGADKTEMLRFVKPVRAAGSTMMIINYRGDRNNPASPDGYTHLGDTEWQDLEAAVRYAKQHGATNIQLYATSLGGSITEGYLRRSNDVAAAHISKVVLDSPALNWKEVLKYRVQKLGYPGFLSTPGMVVSSWRAGIDFDRITTTAKSIRQPTLIIHNADDKTVPQAASKEIAAARPDLVTFVDFGSGGHIRAWNHDPGRYETLITNFLKN